MSWTPSPRELSQYAVTVTFKKHDYINEMGLIDSAMRLVFYCAVTVVKLLWNCDGDEVDRDARATETSLLLSTEKIVISFYGTSEEDLESGKGSNTSSDDLYDGKLCAICYDGQRSCVFVPCGHCVTCYTCAYRIINDEIRTCPICRTIIQRVRKLHFVK
ncbi:hypothetical protein ACJIZ3_008022 [Penstemon smallii]|uniref:RING-type domain-containing protein n=1 Tax=Penstemon smallii TaxID=265156 RepID=A0ABD3T8K0_9LAMI